MLEKTIVLYTSLLKKIVFLFVGISSIAILSMILVTIIDIILRIFGQSFVGAYDIVSVAGGVAISCALPYTTAVKGHIAIEYFFHKLPHKSRIITDTAIRMISIILFSTLTYKSFFYGISLLETGEVTPTLQLPVFWLPIVISFSTAIMTLVILHNLLHPGREMIKP